MESICSVISSLHCRDFLASFFIKDEHLHYYLSRFITFASLGLGEHHYQFVVPPFSVGHFHKYIHSSSGPSFASKVFRLLDSWVICCFTNKPLWTLKYVGLLLDNIQSMVFLPRETLIKLHCHVWLLQSHSLSPLQSSLWVQGLMMAVQVV